MKSLKKLKLNQLREADLSAKEMSELKGGQCCGCGCHGPSSTSDNYRANYRSGYGSVGGSTYCICWDGRQFEPISTK